MEVPVRERPQRFGRPESAQRLVKEAETNSEAHRAGGGTAKGSRERPESVAKKITTGGKEDKIVVKKRITAILLTFAMVVTAVPTTAFVSAEELEVVETVKDTSKSKRYKTSLYKKYERTHLTSESR